MAVEGGCPGRALPTPGARGYRKGAKKKKPVDVPLVSLSGAPKSPPATSTNKFRPAPRRVLSFDLKAVSSCVS